MNAKTAALLLSGLLAACAETQPPEAAAPPAPSPPPAPAASAPGPAPAQAAEPAPADRIVTIRRAGCQDLLKLPPEDRSAAAMFYIGYQASRFGSRTINVSMIPSIEAQALTYCAEKPDRTVAEAFAEAYSRNRK